MSNARNAKPVVVAGGGIGGLAAAAGLAARGFRVLVLEQANQFGEIGAGIQLAPNAWTALDALGVARLVRNDIYRNQSAESYYEALDWIFKAPDYARGFRRP